MKLWAAKALSSTNARSSRLSKFFEFERHNTTLSIEVLAGISTYMALAYIFIVNPAILGTTGIDPSAALFATIVASSISTIVMGLWAKLPFAVAPGLEMNGFFAFVVCKNMHLTWQQGLGTVFASGLLCILFTKLRIRRRIIDSIPTGLKKAVGTSVGLFVATIGLYLAKILSFNHNGLVDFSQIHLESLGSKFALILYVGLATSVLFNIKKLRIPGGMLIAIAVSSILYQALSLGRPPGPELSTKMFQAVGQADLTVIVNPAFWSPIIVFFIIDFVGGIGKFIGLTTNTSIQNLDGNVPRIKKGLYVDGGGTVLGSLLGTSSLIAFVESAVGIQAGGRTGLTAVVCGVLMAFSVVFSPFLTWIPAAAAAGVLVYVGYLLLPSVYSNGVRHLSNFDLVISTVMGVVSIGTFSLDKALAIGFWAYGFRTLNDQNDGKRAYWLLAIAAVLTLTIVWQWLITP